MRAAPRPRRRVPCDTNAAMLNGRLYRLSWLVAGVALLVALLTLLSPSPGP